MAAARQVELAVDHPGDGSLVQGARPLHQLPAVGRRIVALECRRHLGAGAVDVQLPADHSGSAARADLQHRRFLGPGIRRRVVREQGIDRPARVPSAGHVEDSVDGARAVQEGPRGRHRRPGHPGVGAGVVGLDRGEEGVAVPGPADRVDHAVHHADRVAGPWRRHRGLGGPEVGGRGGGRRLQIRQGDDRVRQADLRLPPARSSRRRVRSQRSAGRGRRPGMSCAWKPPRVRDR